jgi:GH35 family endo-1,4-beta-xylanase
MVVHKYVGTFAFVAALALASPYQSTAQTAEDIESYPAIHEVYADHFTFGALLSYPHIGLPGDPRVPGQGTVVAPSGGYLIRHHMNFMAPGNNMKAQNTVDIAASRAAYENASSDAERDSIDVHPVVRFNGNMIAQLNWAQRHGFGFRAHTLVWHNQTPGTAFFREGYSNTGARLTPERMTERMSYYIHDVFRLLREGWPGMVTAVDVVNEKILWDGAERTADNEWYATYGDMSYVAEAFRLAREHSVALGETQMKLYYNDYNTHSSSKANGIVQLLTPISEAGHLDGIGMQQHDGRTSPSAAQWVATYDKFAAIADEIAITELDVNPRTQSGQQVTDRMLTEQANQYAMLFKLFMERSAGSGRGKIVNVTKDGLNDQYAFVADASLWDADNQPKAAYFAVVDVARYFNGLDSLLAEVALLDETQYSTESWQLLMNAVADAELDLSDDYSYFQSAVAALGAAYSRLETAIAQLSSSVSAEMPTLASQVVLGSSYPNPTSHTATIDFELPTTMHVSLEVFDLLGRRVAELAEGRHSAGAHSVSFDVRDLPSGPFLIRLRADGSTASRMMNVVR